MRRLLLAAALILVAAAAALWSMTIPARIQAGALAPRTPDLANGRTMFYAGGCPACHAPDREDATRLAGGVELKTPFGKFFAPNISPDPSDGIGGWSEADFVTAMSK